MAVDRTAAFPYNTLVMTFTGCGSAWLERLVWDQEAAGSNPVTPIFDKCRKSNANVREINGLRHLSCLFCNVKL